MSTLNADLRAGAVSLLRDYASDAKVKLSTSPGRPGLMDALPRAFVDTMSSRIAYDGLMRQTPTAIVLVVWGLFDSAMAVKQRDAFVDGFIDWWAANKDAAGPNTVSGVTSIEDLPAYVPDWIHGGDQTAYFATAFTVEGYGE